MACPSVKQETMNDLEKRAHELTDRLRHHFSFDVNRNGSNDTAAAMLSSFALAEQRLALESTNALLTSFAEQVEAEIAHQSQPKGGQQAGVYGEFARCPMSVLLRLRWWANALKGARQCLPVTK